MIKELSRKFLQKNKNKKKKLQRNNFSKKSKEGTDCQGITKLIYFQNIKMENEMKEVLILLL